MLPAHREPSIPAVVDDWLRELDGRAAVERRQGVAFAPQVRGFEPNIRIGTPARATGRRPRGTCTSPVPGFYAPSPVVDGFSTVSTDFRTGGRPIVSFVDRYVWSGDDSLW